MPGVSLNEAGRAEAGRLARHFARASIEAVYTSPLDRTRETADPIAAAAGCPLHAADALLEIDCGAWTGMSFADLGDDPRWRHWNEARAAAAVPGGETMAAVRERAMAFVAGLSERDGPLVLVSHGDVIKAVVMAVLGLSLDRHDAFAIDPASVTTLAHWGTGGRVVRLNEAVAG